jgi:hypothetical protein
VFRYQIEENLRLNIPLKTADDIEEVIEKFNNVIQNSVWSTTPGVTLQTEYPEYQWEIKGQLKGKKKT